TARDLRLCFGVRQCLSSRFQLCPRVMMKCGQCAQRAARGRQGPVLILEARENLTKAARDRRNWFPRRPSLQRALRRCQKSVHFTWPAASTAELRIHELRNCPLGRRGQVRNAQRREVCAERTRLLDWRSDEIAIIDRDARQPVAAR